MSGISAPDRASRTLTDPSTSEVRELISAHCSRDREEDVAGNRVGGASREPSDSLTSSTSSAARLSPREIIRITNFETTLRTFHSSSEERSRTLLQDLSYVSGAPTSLR
jgi:hypothetical protein